MAKAKECDKCGGLYKIVCDIPIVHVTVYYPVEGNREIDLCPKCKEALIKWLEKEQTMDERAVKIILAMAAHDMYVSKVAEAMFMHYIIVVYHLNRIKRITGLDPRRFYDLCKLVQMVRERRQGE